MTGVLHTQIITQKKTHTHIHVWVLKKGRSRTNSMELTKCKRNLDKTNTSQLNVRVCAANNTRKREKI